MAALAGVVLSNPTPSPIFGQISTRDSAVTAAAALLQIAPTSGSCSGAPAAGECATNVQAAPYLISAMQQYSIYNLHEVAAVLSVIAYESGEFKYNINHYPGTPGQGTRNMQMASFNLMYAKSIPALATSLSAITTADSTSGLSTDQVNAIRVLVLPDEYTWASGAWFYSTQCSSSVKSAVQAGGQAGWDAYLGCIGATDSSESSARLAYWTRANTAFGLS
ncbi:uncharacterized protein LY89DRAFT_690986 [Mollisia scopiformis]|uniref:Transglycosylase SLT domain-containing protein n=1 Tax=Mollisia scopiformis TaxID=149040 RepID=A0A132B826_MOLSC|nr:uncharacterized protein LY89DRAFT_690986 [Mollisia scopiformis]KUJ08552.1 hypothetical protein LY89DRAFT_690986 [Mollisia scopiformis]